MSYSGEGIFGHDTNGSDTVSGSERAQAARIGGHLPCRRATGAKAVLWSGLLLGVLLCGCGNVPDAAAPGVPGDGGTVAEDEALSALGLKLAHYVTPPPLDPASIVEQRTYRQDLHRSGNIPGAVVRDDYVLAWEINGINPGKHTAAKGSPAIVASLAGPQIIVGGDSGVIYSFKEDGTLDWSHQTLGSRFGIHGTPAVENGMVYIGAYDGTLYAFAAGTGELIFHTRIGDSIGSSPLVYDGKVYVSVETRVPSGILAILDAYTGEILWRDDDLRNHPHSSVALDPEHDIMVVGDNSGDLTAWYLESPRRRWVFKTGDSIKGPILLYDGAAFFGSWDKHLYAVDLEQGTERWRVPVDHRAMSGAAVAPDLGLVYMGSHDKRLYAVEARSGRVAWRYQAAAGIVSSPTVADGRVLFGSHDGSLHIVDAARGKLIYRFKARGVVSSSPAILGDRIVFTERSIRGLPGSMYVLAPLGSDR